MSLKLKERAHKYFLETGFHNLLVEERLKRNKDAFSRLDNIQKNDYEGIKRITRILGGKRDDS